MADAVKTEPVIRVRVGHDFTVKDGHRLKETTVEYTSGSDGTINWDRINHEMKIAFLNGQAEAVERNNHPLSSS